MIIFGFLILVLCGALCAYLASRKGRSVFLWFFFGALSGPLSIFIVLFLLLSSKLEADGTVCQEEVEQTPRNAARNAAKYSVIFGLCYYVFTLLLIGLSLTGEAKWSEYLVERLIDWTIKPLGNIGVSSIFWTLVAFAILFVFYMSRYRSKAGNHGLERD